MNTAILPKNSASFETAEAAEVRIGYTILRFSRDPTPLIDRAGDAAVHAGRCTQIFYGTVLPAKGVAHKTIRAKTEIWRVGIGLIYIRKGRDYSGVVEHLESVAAYRTVAMRAAERPRSISL